MEGKLEQLQKRISAFPTKADLDEFWFSVQCLIKDELAERDLKIGKLEEENAVLKNEILDIKTKLEKCSTTPTPITPVAKKQDSLIGPLNDLDLLIIGDSIVKHIKPDKFGTDVRAALVCVPGGNVQDIRKHLIDVHRNAARIGKVILSVGTNHVPHQHPDTVAENILSLVNEIKTNMPATKVILNSLLPKYSHKKTDTRCISLLPGIQHINSFT